MPRIERIERIGLGGGRLVPHHDLAIIDRVVEPEP